MDMLKDTKNTQLINKYMELEFPLTRYFYKPNKKLMIEKLENFHEIIHKKVPTELKKYQKSGIIVEFMYNENSNDEFFIIKDDFIKNEHINEITTYFTDHVRMKAIFKGYPSPKVYWDKNRERLVRDAIKMINKGDRETHNDDKITHSDISQLEKVIRAIREIMNAETKFCNNFRVTVAVAVLRYFKPKTWLDISSGWGDRLITALLMGITNYTAADPNLDLHPCYEKIMETFATSEQRENYKIHPTGFLEAPIPDDKIFDLVFAGPPFFNLETYSSYEGDSLKGNKNEDQWTDNFLIPSLEKCYKHLKPGGDFVLYVYGNERTMNKMYDFGAKMWYRGVIYFYDTTPRTLYVWKKIK